MLFACKMCLKSFLMQENQPFFLQFLKTTNLFDFGNFHNTLIFFSDVAKSLKVKSCLKLMMRKKRQLIRDLYISQCLSCVFTHHKLKQMRV